VLSALTVATLICASAAGRPPESVALDLTGFSAENHRRYNALGLERIILQRLVEEGFAAVPVSGSSDVRVRITVEGQNVVLEGKSQQSTVTRTIQAGPHSKLHFVHLEVAQKVIEVARLALRAAAEQAPAPVEETPVAAPEPLPVSLPPVLRTPQVSPLPAVVQEEPSGVLSVGVGALARPGGIDPQARLGFRWESTKWVPLIELSLAPSFASGLRVLDWELQVGVLRQLVRTSSAVVAVGVLLGGGLHQFWLTENDREPGSGVVPNATANGIVQLDWQPWKSSRLWVRVGGGASLVEPVHAFDGQVVWRRGLATAHLGIGAAWTF
jgi:hypothetical protein